MKKKGLIIVLLFTIVSGAAALSGDAWRPLPVTGDFNKPGGDLTEKDIAWKEFTNFFEQEHGYMIARFDQGYWLFLTIFTFKYGPQQRWGVYSIVSSDSGKQWFARREILVNEAKLSHEGISWESHGTSIGGSYPRYTYTIKEEAYQAKLAIESRFPGWKLGRWYLTPDKKSFGEVFIYIPWGRISGTLTLDGKQISVSGNAYADRFHGSMRLDRTDPMFFSVRSLTPLPGYPEISIQTSYNHFNPAFGKVSIPSLMIMGQQGFVRATENVVIKGDEYYKDQKLGYFFPRKLTVTAEDAGFTFHGQFTAQRNMEMLDIISQVPPYLRMLVETFVKLPVYSKWDGVFEGAYTLNGKETRFKIRAAAENALIGGPETQVR